MERFWRAALGVAGIGAIAFFVFLSLYKQWLSLPIFSTLTADQTFVVMLVFLGLTFTALVSGLVVWLASERRQGGDDAPLSRLEQAWKGVNYVDCNALVGPDVNKAANALQLTSAYWKQGFIAKPLLLEQYGQQFCELFEQIDGCDKPVPGYTAPVKRCRDFLPASMRAAYTQIKKELRR